MDNRTPTRTQVAIWLAYDYSPQEKESLLVSLATQFGIRRIDEVPINEAHERRLCFFTDGTNEHDKPLLEFLEQQKQAGVHSTFTLMAVEEELAQRSYMLALCSPQRTQEIARWYNHLRGQRVTVPAPAPGDSSKKQAFVVRETHELLLIPNAPGYATALARVILQPVPPETGGHND